MAKKTFSGKAKFSAQKQGTIVVEKVKERGFAVSPDGSMVALIRDDEEAISASVKSGEGTIYIMTPTGEVIRELVAPEYYYSRVARIIFSPDGNELIAIYGFKSGYFYAVYDTRSWERKVAAYLGQTDRVLDFDVSPDGKWLTLSTRHTKGFVFVVEIGSGRMDSLAGHEGHFGGEIAFSLFGAQEGIIYSGGSDGAMIAWKVAGPRDKWDGRQLYKKEKRRFTSGSLSIDGSTLAVGWHEDGSNALGLYDINSGDFGKVISANLRAITFSSSGHLLGIQEPYGSKVSVWDGTTLESVAELELDSQFSDMFFAPGGRNMIGQPNESERVEVWTLF